MKNYLQFIEYLKEGLIISHDITRYSTTLTSSLDQLNIKYKISIIDKLEFNLTIYNPNIDIVNVIEHKSFVLGYFPSYYWVVLNNGMKNSFKYDEFNLPSNTSEITIKFESKYDDGLHKNDNLCPDKLYNLTYLDNKDSIFEKGIYPKSNKRLSVHPDRIYLFDNIENYKVLLNNLKMSDRINNINKPYLLLEIDCTERSLIIHTDPNYRLGYFTYDNINPIDIKIIDENI